VIAELDAAGVPVTEIARRLGVRYQIVYQCLQSSRPAAGLSVSFRSGTKSDQMRALFSDGKSVAEVSRSMGVDYAFAYGVAQRAGYVGTAARRRGRASARDAVPEASLAKGATEPLGEAPGGLADAILLGCVKMKDKVPRAAKDLYISPLFRGRRRYAEASGKPWWIVSAEYGLLAPEEVVAPYDTLIGSRPLAERRQIANQVADRLAEELGPLSGKLLELHAGIEYADAIGPELRRRGAQLVRPLEGLSFGRQLAWYSAGGGPLALAALPKRTAAIRQARRPSTFPLGDGRGLGRRITEAFVTGGLDLSGRQGAPTAGWPGMPEIVAASALRNAGANDVTIRLFLTFCAAMDRARDADRLARAAVRMHAVHAWAFDPAQVVQRSLRELTATLRTFGVSQRHSTDAYGWRVIAESLADRSAPAVTAAIQEGEADASDLLRELAAVGDDGGPLFPLLGGPKIGPLWIRLMAYPGGASIRRLERVPVAVDVQVRKVTEYLGVTETMGADLEDVRSSIQETWRIDVERHGSSGPDGLANTSGALDPALWFYAKWGCTFCERAGHKRPIAEPCRECRFPTRAAPASIEEGQG
jgi:hypothetical protein